MVSAVWQYCTRLPNNMVRCNTCERVMSYHGTTNLRVHIGRHFGMTPKRHRETGRVIRVVHLPQPSGRTTPQPRISYVTHIAQPIEESIMPIIQGTVEAVPIEGDPNSSRDQDIAVRWDAYQSNMQAVFPILLANELFVDVTLACGGQAIKCHKIVLAACSTYFEQLLTQNPSQHPIILMKDLHFWEVQALVEFMYRGEVNIPQNNLPNLLAAANALKIKGLTDSNIYTEPLPNGDSSPIHSPRDEQQCAAPAAVSTSVLTPVQTPVSPRTSDHGRAFYRRIRKTRSSPSTQTATSINPPPLQPCPRQQQRVQPPMMQYYQYDSSLNNSGTQYMGLPGSTYTTEHDSPPTKRKAESPEMTIDPMMIKTEPLDSDDENIYNSNDSMDPLGNCESEDEDVNSNKYDDETAIDMPSTDFHETLDRKNDDAELENRSGSSKGLVLTPETEMDTGDQANGDDEYDED